MGRPIVFAMLILLTTGTKVQAQQAFSQHTDTLIPYGKKLLILPQNFYNRHLSFFCTKEIELQKLTKTNLFIRLGSKEYVDYMEQKPNARKGF